MTTVTSPIIYNIQNLTINFNVSPSSAEESPCVDELAREEPTPLKEKKLKRFTLKSKVKKSLIVQHIVGKLLEKLRLFLLYLFLLLLALA